MTNNDLAARIIDAVLADLHDRSGIGDVIESVKVDDPDFYHEELIPELRLAVENVLDLERP